MGGEILTSDAALKRLESEHLQRCQKVTKRQKVDSQSDFKKSSNIAKNHNTSSFQTIIIPGYGDCLFAAAAKAIFGSFSEHISTLVRNTAVEYVLNHWDEFSESISVYGVSDKGSYQALMTKPGVYGDNPEIAAISAVYRVCIKIHVGADYKTHGDSIYNKKFASSNTIHLHFDPIMKHYNLLVPNSSDHSLKGKDHSGLSTQTMQEKLFWKATATDGLKMTLNRCSAMVS